MMIFLHKLLPIFVLPLGITFLLFLAAWVFKRRWLAIIAVIFLYFCSTPFISNQLMRIAENHAVRLPMTAMPSADAIVVLSGGRVAAPGKEHFSEWTDADRFFAGVELLKANKAPQLIFTGGWAPWQSRAPLEGQVLEKYAEAFNVPKEKIHVTGKVVNTEEEAGAVVKLLINPAMKLQKTILLVTSAFHMPRAKFLFEQVGFKVIAFPVDFKVSEDQITILDFLPSASALEQTEIAWREMLGRVFYWVKQFF